MVEEAEQMREADQAKRETVTAKNDAETLGYQVEKQMTELKEKISKDDADDLKKKLDDLRALIGSDAPDLEELKEKTKTLQEASWKVTQQVYQNASGNEQKDGASEEPKKE